VSIGLAKQRHLECFRSCISDVIDMFQIEVPMFPLILVTIGQIVKFQNLGIQKTAAISLVFHRSSPTCVKTLGLRFGSYWWRQKRKVFLKNQDGGRRHLRFQKTSAISLLFNWSSPTFLKTLGLWFWTYRWRKKCKVSKFQNNCRRHYGFWKTVVISLLIDQLSSNYYCYSDLEHMGDVKNAYLEQFQLAVAANFIFVGRLLFIYYLTDLHHT